MGLSGRCVRSFLKGKPNKCFSCVDHFAHDAWQELRGVPFRDDAFTEKQWQRHLTWRRFVPEPNISGIVILSLAPIWLWSVAVSAAVGLYATFAEPKGAPIVSQHPGLVTPFSLTSFALSLLMLFKTTSSYNRWWECRTLWGSGYITVRSILRLCQSYVGHRHPELVPALYRWTAAILPSMAAYLRDRDHYLTEHLEGVLLPEELAYVRQRLADKGIPPIAVLQVLSRLLDRAQLPDIERQQVEALVSHFDVIIGGCERILRQPIPYAWNRHTHRFILVYVTFLPFAFWATFEWATLPIMAVFTFLICGVENIGVQIEEPHRVLPLNQICSGGLKALRLMMQDEHSSAAMAEFAAHSSSSSSSGSSNGTAQQPPDLPPHKVGSGLAGGSSSGSLFKQPLPAVVSTVRSSGSRPADGGGGVVELSLPSAVSTPPTARPISPDVLDSVTVLNGVLQP